MWYDSKYTKHRCRIGINEERCKREKKCKANKDNVTNHNRLKNYCLQLDVNACHRDKKCGMILTLDSKQLQVKKT